MFYHIRGELILLEPNAAVIDAEGVGYRMTISQNTAEALSSKINSEVRLFTHMAVREDGVELFGFGEKAELDSFKSLISVSGVGPKVAMAVLSLFTPDRLSNAIANEDVKAISKASGVGSKTAARIVLELKDKVTALPKTAGGISLSSSGSDVKTPGVLGEATDALTVLGYSRSEITEAVRGLDTQNMTVEQVITAALRRFTK